MGKKLFIIIFTLIVTFCSVVYVYIKTPIYEVKSIMEIGFLENKTIDDPAMIEQKLNIILQLRIKYK